jgi:hypothetical protein
MAGDVASPSWWRSCGRVADQDEDFVPCFKKKNINEAVSCIGSWWAGSWAELDGLRPDKLLSPIFFVKFTFLFSVSDF